MTEQLPRLQTSPAQSKRESKKSHTDLYSTVYLISFLKYGRGVLRGQRRPVRIGSLLPGWPGDSRLRGAGGSRVAFDAKVDGERGRGSSPTRGRPRSDLQQDEGADGASWHAFARDSRHFRVELTLLVSKKKQPKCHRQTKHNPPARARPRVRLNGERH